MPRRRKPRKPVDTTTLDRFGRVLLPKPLRDRVGLRPGDSLHIEVREGSLVLEPVRVKPGIAWRGSMPVLVGYRLPEGFDWKGIIRRDREARIRKIAGRIWPK